MTERMFPDVPLLGELAPAELATRLEIAPSKVTRGLFAPSLYLGVAHQFGYIAPRSGGVVVQKIDPIGISDADQNLVGKRLIVHLDTLHTQEYPGAGEHQVLVTCSAVTQIEGVPQPICFSHSFRAADGASAALTGVPVFVGLEVGKLGIALSCSTVNVSSSGDDAFLHVIEGTPFTEGLELLTTAQPALKLFTTMTMGIAKMLATRSRNYLVQDFYLGLDLAPAGTGARLRTGSYVAAQVPTPTTIAWADWIYDPNSGGVVAATDHTKPLPFNYVVVRISEMT